MNETAVHLHMRPIAMPNMPTRKNVLFSHPILPAMNGMKNRTLISTPPSNDIAVAIWCFSKPQSANTNGVKIEKFNSCSNETMLKTNFINLAAKYSHKHH